MTNSPDHSPVDDSIDPDKEARMLLNPPNDSVKKNDFAFTIK